MPRVVRVSALLVVSAVALAAAACGSNNKGKIEGKWKATSIPDLPANVPAGMVNMVMEFTPDGRMVTNMEMLGTKQEVMSANYSLGTGDWVNFTNMKPAQKDGKTKSRDKVVINGDTMTFQDDKGKTLTFARMQPGDDAKKK